MAYVGLFVGLAVALRGHYPKLFVRHIEAQVIAGIPSRSQESIGAWILVLLLCFALGFTFSWIHKQVFPEKPDIAKSVIEAMRKMLDQRQPSIAPSPSSGAVSGRPLSVHAPPAPSGAPLLIELEPYIILKRTRVKIDNDDLTFRDYGLAAIVHVRNNGAEPQYVRKLEIVGDVAANCTEYLVAFKENGKDIRELLQDYKNREPFHRISWVSWPIGETRVDPKGGERFVRFLIVQPERGGRIYSSLPGQQPDIPGYFGFKYNATVPRILTTVPYVFDLVYFASETEEHEGRDPKLRGEVERGEVSMTLVIGARRVVLLMKQVKSMTSRLDTEWERETPQDLFYGTDPEHRATPVSRDPAILQ